MAYRYRPSIGPRLRKRQEGLSDEVKEIAWNAQHRLHKRYRTLSAAGKEKQKVITAVGRELLGFIWAIGVQAERNSKRVARFQTKPEIALQQIRTAVEREIVPAPVLADAAYGNDTKFRAGITELGLLYVVGVQSSVSVWQPGHAPLPKRKWRGIGRPSKLLRRNRQHTPIAARQLAMSLAPSAWKTVRWREGTRKPLRSRFAALPVRPAHRDDKRSELRAEEWLLIEWPSQEAEPTKYWLSTLPQVTKLTDLVRMAKHRWVIERDYQELKQELGLGHYEGRGWRGFHHHATLCIAAYGFLVAERSRFSPSARAGQVDLPVSEMPPQLRPRGSPGTHGAA